MATLRVVTLFAALATVYSKVLIGLDDKNVNFDREVTEEDDSVEYNIEHGNGNDGTDMMLSQEQMDWINGDGSERALAISNWPRTGSYVNIPYTKDENNPWGNFENGNIQAAVDAYAENTCIRFVPRTTEEDYIHMISDSGCWSNVGKVGGKQSLSLKANSDGGGCASQVGTPIHELMHAIGYLHEQMRSDRDQYVKINFDNVKPGKEGNFNLCEGCDLQDQPYDMGSVMHYHQWAFAIDYSIPTIVALDGTSGDLMGQRSGFSPLDIEGINKVYCECAVDSDCDGTGTCNGGVCSYGAVTTPEPETTPEPATTPEPTTSTPEENCIDINVVTKRWGYENSWTFGACSSTQEYPNRATTTERCCQPAGDYELDCKCSYGDGWHGGYLEINGQKYCKRFKDGHSRIETATMGNSASGTTVATSDGTVYEKVSTNAECCESRSITESEDGTQWRWPLLYQNDDGTFKCMGGHKKTYQEWVDYAGSRYENICIDGWRYSKTE